MTALRYPPARREAVNETMGGITLDDPYRWLEDDTDEVLSWQDAQNALAQDHLTAWPGFSRLEKVIADLVADARIFPPVPRGGRWFRQVVLQPDDDHPVLVVSPEPAGEHRVLVDPNRLSSERGVTVALDWFYPSPDGTKVAFGLSEGGDEQSVLHVIDTESGDLLPDRIEHAAHASVSWLPDSSGFWCSVGTAAQTVSMARRVILHHLGHDAPIEEVTGLDLGDNIIAHPQLSDDGRWLALYTGAYHVRPWYLRDVANGGEWTPFLKDRDRSYHGVFVDDCYVALTTDGAPRGRVVSIPLATAGDEGTWTELVPESEANRRALGLAGGKLLLAEIVDGQTRVEIASLDGTIEGEVPTPGSGQLLAGGTDPEATQISLLYTALDESPSVHLYDVSTRAMTALTEPAVKVEGIATKRFFATSPDGTRVPVTLWHRGDLDLDVPRSTLIYGYGGFNIPHLPAFSSAWLSFVRAGGVFVMPNLRGGGEYGEEWWQAGRLANKQNTFDDLYAVAEQLIADGITTTDQLSVIGGSNGGLLTGVAITQRPDLWRAVVSLVPVYDLFRTVLRDPFTSYATVHEYGDPRQPEQAAWLAEYSPYHAVSDGTAYPALLIGAGDRDVRCPPWHSRKLAAYLQSATTSDRPILLTVQDQAGHGAGKPSKIAIRNATEWIGFVMSQTGLTI